MPFYFQFFLEDFLINLDWSEEESINCEEVGEDADDVDEDAVADKEMDLKKTN